MSRILINIFVLCNNFISVIKWYNHYGRLNTIVNKWILRKVNLMRKNKHSKGNNQLGSINEFMEPNYIPQTNWICNDNKRVMPNKTIKGNKKIKVVNIHAI